MRSPCLSFLSGAVVRPLVAVLVLSGLTACGGDGGTAPPPPPTTGSLVVQASGLPTGLTATYQIVAADGAQRTVSAGDTVRNLAPGTTTIRPSSPRSATIGRWIPFAETFDATIVAGQTATRAISFLAAPVILQMNSVGLPSNAIASARFTGPDGATYTTTAGVPFLAPSPGQWTLAGLPVIAADYAWNPTGEPISRALLPGDTAIANVPYVATTGAIRVSTPGLDSTLQPRFTLRSGTVTLTRTGAGTFGNLAPGTWELTASTFAVTGFRFTPNVATQVLTVTAGTTAAAAVSYLSVPVPTNLSVEGAYLTQAVQLPNGSLPLVAGRDALLRIFLRATTPNTWRPPVRATLYQGATVLETFDIAAAGPGVDTVVDEGSRQRTWNVRIPGARIVPGLRLRVEADPDRTIAGDGDPDDNVWPRGSTPASIDVRALAPWRAVLVPVINNERTGNVTGGNRNQFTSAVRQMLPMHEVDITVRQPYTSNAGALQSSDGNGAWLALLAEMNTLRVLDSASASAYYYGIVSVTYSSGIAGYGFVPGRAAVGWDYLPSGNLVAAHEWGHNFGRRHSPCGNVSGADPAYPYSGGVTGAWGWNPDTDLLMAPTATDLMGYCGNQWVSDFTWRGAFQYRAGTPNAIVAAANATAAHRGGLLVWGEMRDGRVTLEPSFFVPDHSVRPTDDPVADRTMRVEAVDADGRVMASALVPAPRVDHANGEVHQFATVLPLSAEQHERLASVRASDVRSPLIGNTRRRNAVADAQAGIARELGGASALVRRGRAADLTWTDARVSGALVRDAATGQVLSIMRASGGRVQLPSGNVDVIFSDGVRSRVQRIVAQ
jgi:hypothetical protein